MARRAGLSAVVRHPHEPRVLLLRSDRTWRLPRVRAPDVWVANAEAVVRAFEPRLGTTPWLLRQLRPAEPDEAAVDAVVELELRDPRWPLPAHARWAGRDELERLRLREDERPRVEAYLRDLDRVPPERAPWARPGWRERVEVWLAATVDALGHRLLAVEQVKHWSISAVLRVRTDGPELYLKVPARLPLFVEEAAVTAALAERYPEHVPAPVAVEPDEGWLLLPAFDELPGWDSPVELRREVLARFARLQRRTAGEAAELLALGCIDRRLDVLLGQLPRLVGDRRALARLEPAERRSVRGSVPAFEEACRRLAELGPPPALVHGDLHLGNVARLGGRLVYFDWTDACVAHPFVDLLSLRWEKDGAVRDELLDAYLAEWEGIAPPERLREAAAVAAVAIPLHHAVSYQRIVGALEPVARPELDATHEFLREAVAAARAL